jgi:hypothetical protein
MSGTWISRTFSIAILAALTTIGLLASPVVGAAQSREADGARLLKGALDLHFHMDPWTPGALNGQAGIAEVRVAKARGMRGLVIKDHTGSSRWFLNICAHRAEHIRTAVMVRLAALPD